MSAVLQGKSEVELAELLNDICDIDEEISAEYDVTIPEGVYEFRMNGIERLFKERIRIIIESLRQSQSLQKGDLYVQGYYQCLSDVDQIIEDADI